MTIAEHTKSEAHKPFTKMTGQITHLQGRCCHQDMRQQAENGVSYDKVKGVVTSKGVPQSAVLLWLTL